MPDSSSMGMSSSDDDNEKVFMAEKIMGRKTDNGTTYYLVKWQGFKENESTWEPIGNLLNCKDMIEHFENNASSHSAAIKLLKPSIKQPFKNVYGAQGDIKSNTPSKIRKIILVKGKLVCTVKWNSEGSVIPCSSDVDFDVMICKHPKVLTGYLKALILKNKLTSI